MFKDCTRLRNNVICEFLVCQTEIVCVVTVRGKKARGIGKECVDVDSALLVVG